MRIIRNILTLQVFIMDDENVLYIRSNGIHSIKKTGKLRISSHEMKMYIK